MRADIEDLKSADCSDYADSVLRSEPPVTNVNLYQDNLSMGVAVPTRHNNLSNLRILDTVFR
jgi:hypothetical protein